MALQVDVVGPDRVLWSGQASGVVAPSVEGEIGLLRGHEPILSVLGAGRIKVTQLGGEQRVIEITDGFISFDHDVVTIIANPLVDDPA